MRWSSGRLKRSLVAVYSIATFIRDIRTLLQIRQVVQLRSTTCNLQGLSPTQRSTQTTPSRDLTLGVMQLVTLRAPEPVGHPLNDVCPHRQGNPYGSSSLWSPGDHKLEEPSRGFPTGLGIDARDLSAYDHFLQVSRRILHHHQVVSHDLVSER